MPASMEVVFDLTGVLSARVAAGVEAALDASAERLLETARERILSGPKTGRIYTHGPEPLPHQASAPGESPANWQGELAASGEVQVEGPMVRAVAFTSDHAVDMELGTRDGRTAARPFLLPAVEEERLEFYAAMAAVVEAAGRG